MRSLMRSAGRALRPRSDAIAFRALPPDAASYQRLADHLEGYLRDDFLTCWYPRAVDTERGGFHQDFAEDWSPRPPSDRMIVAQARHTWVCARAAELMPELAPHALGGLEYLAGPMWDQEHAGPYFFVGLDGRADTERGGEKHTCGVVFSIFAAVAVFEATHDPRALDLARRVFEWLDRVAHDGENGGYFEALARDGSPLHEAPQAGWHDEIGTPYGFKSLNTHIHVLEALAALLRVDPGPLVRARLEELLALIRDRLIVEPGALHFYFTHDWRALPMHNSFGHDVEAAYLLLDACDTLGRGDDPETQRAARAVVDHALDWGWDRKNGGLWYAGQALGPPLDRSKSWWVQAEGLNALLHMHEHHGHESDRYWTAVLAQLDFIFAHQIDARHGGWFARVSEDGREVLFGREKATAWKTPYHDGRALMNAVAIFRRLSGSPKR
jgi:mannobiose 2-epimerase